MGFGSTPELDVFPLLEVAQNMAPIYSENGAGSSLVGDDSYSGKREQLDQIREVLADFTSGDWITYRDATSEALRSRLDSSEPTHRTALAWDLLVEFGSVLGAARIWPGAGSDLRYYKVPRAAWMLPLAGRADMRVVYEIYCRHMASLDERQLVTSDQVLSDFLGFLQSRNWNRLRRSHGYDLVFVDEFHYFNPLERQVLHYLTRDVAVYPKIFMAMDPRQSPSLDFLGSAADQTTSLGESDSPDDDQVANFELTSVHRFTPQILTLVKHIHHNFPTFDLGQDWDIDFAGIESARSAGSLPVLISCGTRAAEEIDIYRAVRDLYSHGRIAVAVVDTRQWDRFSALAARLRQGKFHVSIITSQADTDSLRNRHHGVVVGPAEYLAGLQFPSAIVAGIPEISADPQAVMERTRFLSLLYLAISRAEEKVHILVNDDDGGAPGVLRDAADKGLVVAARGSEV